MSVTTWQCTLLYTYTAVSTSSIRLQGEVRPLLHDLDHKHRRRQPELGVEKAE